MTRSAARVTVAVALLAVAAACDYVPNSPSVPLTRTDIRIGTGEEARPGRLLSIHIEGWIHNPGRPDDKGVQFATTRNGLPFFFTMGSGEVIRGITLGMEGMRAGGFRRVLVPSSLAYGSTGFGVIPPYANLIFEIELLTVQ
jgi:FKBP-type peptidyl-prolyl cis-trans isomerase FkpA